MTEAYDRVVAALPHLTPEERGRIAERLKALNSLAPGQTFAGATGAFPDEPGGGADVLLEVIAGAVLRLSGERVSPAALRRGPSFSAFRAKAREISAFAAKHAPNRVQRRALLALGVELLHRDLSRAGFSVTARTLMACAHQVPAVLDKSFPGYAQSGFLSMVIGRVALGDGSYSREESDGSAKD